MNRILSVICGVFLLVACSGGDSGNNPPPSSDVLGGDFFVAMLRDTNGLPEVVTVNATFDGVGGGAYTDSTGGSGGLSYSISPAGALTLDGFGLGQVRFDGTMLIVSDIDNSDNQIKSLVGIKKSNGLSNATLSGEYGFVEIHYNGALVSTANMNVFFFGDGSGERDYIDSDGASTGFLPFSYSVSNDGAYVSTPGDSRVGQVNADGSVVLIADNDTTDGVLRIMVGVKRTSGLNNAILAGSYHLSQAGSDNPPTVVAMVNADADGSGSVTSIYEDSGGNSGPYDFSYSILDNGYMTNSYGDTGQVSPDGSVIIMSDINNGDGYVMMLVGLGK